MACGRLRENTNTTSVTNKTGRNCSRQAPTLRSQLRHEQNAVCTTKWRSLPTAVKKRIKTTCPQLISPDSFPEGTTRRSKFLSCSEHPTAQCQAAAALYGAELADLAVERTAVTSLGHSSPEVRANGHGVQIHAMEITSPQDSMNSWLPSREGAVIKRKCN